jgi:hypothetical protein
MTMKKVVFWDLASCSLGYNQSFGGTYRLHLQGRWIATRIQWEGGCDSPALKMQAIRSSETSVLTKTTRHQIPEDDFLQTLSIYDVDENTALYKVASVSLFFNYIVIKKLAEGKCRSEKMPSFGMLCRVDLVWSDVSEEHIAAATCSSWFLTRGFFYPEDGGDTFLRNFGSHKSYTAPHPRRRHSS